MQWPTYTQSHKVIKYDCDGTALKKLIECDRILDADIRSDVQAAAGMSAEFPMKAKPTLCFF